jgi:hypothetical protein
MTDNRNGTVRNAAFAAYALEVVWYIDGQRHERHVGNVR